ncbi:DUF1223 domain-containing protein [Flavobacterium sp. Fl-318]|uniref:DUF1223 domain-containing protein n=1 Tax=Flavobacterium cupriresistens TaxID=2893885 RepID=A0ABU4RIR8_9FLAO|nr:MULTISPECIES: DUF1223 domain-containing protein [unclassified Flavobacterium]MDX6191649.1 DUF1223 domain-containing protein [Flavobacterium sp. Fl-318]UFH41593.1 DUF1223 domain-containing protein [Flavobacterium sp. F-323]
MKKIFYLFLAIALLISMGFSTFKEKKAEESKSFVVLELFTSQGCSSCPPADRLLGKYAVANNPDMMLLSFHVDYWNYIGWKDPFSKKEFSERQRQYAATLNSSVYTPQLIINGSESVVGSQESSITSLVKKAREQKPLAELNITAEKNLTNIQVQYDCKVLLVKYKICFALVKKEESTAIKRGENSGLTLTNYNIVTDFKTVPSDSKSGSINFVLNGNAAASEYQIIAFVQDAKSLKILTAAKTEILIQ